MKILFLLTGFLLVIINLHGQRNPETSNDSPNEIFECLNIQLNSKQISPEKKFPYKEIIVIDQRPDTSKCGYWLPHIKSKMAKLCLTNGLQQNASVFFNYYLKNNFDPTGNSLVAYIKKCWISTYDSTNIFYKVSLKMEFYLKIDSFYYPLHRFNESFFHQREYRMEPGKVLEEALIAGIEKLYSPVNVTGKMRKFSLTQIDSFNNQLNKSPILNEKYAPRGIYLNFSQFKNNKPAFTDFRFNIDEKADVLFVRGKNIKDSAITDAWGFSNGENVFIRLKMNYFPIFRSGNTFELYGFKKTTVTRVYSGRVGTSQNPYTNPSGAAADIITQAILSSIKNISRDFKPYQVDMDTGELY